jgi:light-regulated signal transduction histidine kinase (bacteriophytochrome)
VNAPRNLVTSQAPSSLVANLIENADRCNTAAGDIWISTRTVAGNSQLIVANTGTFINPADADRLFEPFQRLNDRASHDGFGLGPHHRRVHRRSPRWHCHRLSSAGRRPFDHGHNPVARIARL